MQKRIRSFVAEYNRRFGATVLLTSHYMADVQALCKRVIVIHHGRILFDGALAALADRFGATKTIGVSLKEGTADLSAYGEVLSTDDERVVLRGRAGSRRPRSTARLLRDLPVADLTIEDPPIEDVIEHVFADARPDGGGGRVVSATVPAPPAPTIGGGPVAFVRGWIDLYLTQMRVAIATNVQYRVANYFYMIGMVAEPVIYLVVWSTVAAPAGRRGRRLHARRVRRVLHRLDARPEHEHRADAMGLGGADPGKAS